MEYGWIVTKDHIAELLPSGEWRVDNVEVVGPSDIQDTVLARLRRGEGEEFKMYDDDGELYYSGRGIDCQGEEPLYDYGGPNAGCTLIRWKGHPDKNAEY